MLVVPHGVVDEWCHVADGWFVIINGVGQLDQRSSTESKKKKKPFRCILEKNHLRDCVYVLLWIIVVSVPDEMYFVVLRGQGSTNLAHSLSKMPLLNRYENLPFGRSSVVAGFLDCTNLLKQLMNPTIILEFSSSLFGESLYTGLTHLFFPWDAAQGLILLTATIFILLSLAEIFYTFKIALSLHTRILANSGKRVGTVPGDGAVMGGIDYMTTKFGKDEDSIHDCRAVDARACACGQHNGGDLPFRDYFDGLRDVLLCCRLHETQSMEYVRIFLTESCIYLHQFSFIFISNKLSPDNMTDDRAVEFLIILYGI
ncbi:hypothetical protein ACJX0J_034670 [Zea mays]